MERGKQFANKFLKKTVVVRFGHDVEKISYFL